MDQSIDQETPRLPLLFCRRCRAGPKGRGPLCEQCGETLVEQGYCPTCESSWKLEVGRPCPKHDVELVEGPDPTDAFLSPGERASLVTVATYSHPNQAHGPRIRLEAEGIPTFLDGERIAGSTPYQVATGGVRLQVPSPLASSARILIAQQWSAPVAADDLDDDWDDLDDAWDDLAPEPGSRRRAIMKGAIVVMLVGPGVVALVRFLSGLLGGP